MGRLNCRRNRIGLNGRNNAALPARVDRRDAPLPSPAPPERNTLERRQSPTAYATPARLVPFPLAPTMKALEEERLRFGLRSRYIRPQYALIRHVQLVAANVIAPPATRRDSVACLLADHLAHSHCVNKGLHAREAHHHEHQGEAPRLRRISAVILLDVAAHLRETSLARPAPARALRRYRRELPPATTSAPPVGRAGPRAESFHWRHGSAWTAAGAG